MNPLAEGPELLKPALDYALAGVACAAPSRPPLPTPCQGWDLETLLNHLSDSLAAVQEVIDSAAVTPRPAAPDPVPDPGPDCGLAARLRSQAARLRAACATAGPPGRLAAIGDREITVGMVMVTAAIEVAVHGWDIFAACGAGRPVPAGLAAPLLAAAPILITPRTRPGLFADPVRLSRPASAGDQLIAYLGRQPGLLYGRS